MLQLAAPIEFFHEASRVAPAGLRFDVKFEKDFRPQHALDLYPRRRADLLQHPAAFAYQNSLLSIALAINRCADAREPLPLFKIIDDHRSRVRNLLAGIQ